MKTLTPRHPDSFHDLLKYRKWRLAYQADDAFITEYLKRFSTREDITDFALRKDMTYCPAHARAAIEEIRLTIMERLPDVHRLGESSYATGIVDRFGHDINSFVAELILPELLPLGKVGVYVDMPSQVPSTKVATKTPYLYTYPIEQIVNWYYNPETYQLETVLLEDHVYKMDKERNLPTDEIITSYRLLQLKEDGIHVTIYQDEQVQQQVVLNLKTIPFVIFELNTALMSNIANYQIALLNLASSDMAFATRSNFPFYIEQYDPGAETMMKMMQSNEEDDKGQKPQQIGVSHGRRYTTGLNAPAFINPSTEPIKLSMEKQDQLKNEIRLLLNLSVANLKPVRASVESKERNDRSLESGLCAIGAVLQGGENQLSEIWSQYEGTTARVVKYPQTYETRSESDRITEAERLDELMTKIPSRKFQQHIARRIATTLLERFLSEKELGVIEAEIMAAPNMTASPSDVRDDVEAGLVSPEFASENLRNYPKGEVEKAAAAHAERAARIVQAQVSVKESGSNRDLNDDKNSQKLVKEGSRDPSMDPDSKKRVRGDGQ